MGTMNFMRSAWAQTALESFAEETKQDVKIKEEKEEAIGDLICDLLHLASHSGMDAGEIHAKSLRTYEGEVVDDE